mmetsp:Transcript_16833/g.32878  ORF Transcript_16833/g.32878 Transcript_16833/m.32878 type:complete len:181 (-) Transcript_16833:157-699(-)
MRNALHKVRRSHMRARLKSRALNSKRHLPRLHSTACQHFIYFSNSTAISSYDLHATASRRDHLSHFEGGSSLYVVFVPNYNIFFPVESRFVVLLSSICSHQRTEEILHQLALPKCVVDLPNTVLDLRSGIFNQFYKRLQLVNLREHIFYMLHSGEELWYELLLSFFSVGFHRGNKCLEFI